MVTKQISSVVFGALVALLLAPPLVIAEEAQGRLAIIYSSAESILKAKGFMESEGFAPKDHENSGPFYGFMGELDFGKVTISADYLTGKNDAIKGGSATDAPTFNPLSESTVEVVDIALGYNVLDHSVIGGIDVTLGYYRLWESKIVTPANWFDGVEIGIKGRRTWDNGFAFIYKLGYVPDSSIHGFLEDYNKMTGEDILNYRLGIEAPIYEDFYIVAGYSSSKLKSHVVEGGSTSIVTFGGGYIGAMYSF